MTYFKNAYTTLRDVIVFTDSRIAVLLCSVSFLYWGAILYFPEQILQRPFYAGLSGITTNEYIWGTVFLSLGFMRLERFFKNKDKFHGVEYYYNYIIRLICCLLTTYIFLTSNLQGFPPVAGDTLVVAILSWWDFFRFDGISYRRLFLNSMKVRGNDG